MLLTTKKLLNIVSAMSTDVQNSNIVEPSQDFPVFNERSLWAAESINNGGTGQDYYDGLTNSIDY